MLVRVVQFHVKYLIFKVPILCLFLHLAFFFRFLHLLIDVALCLFQYFIYVFAELRAERLKTLKVPRSRLHRLHLLEGINL